MMPMGGMMPPGPGMPPMMPGMPPGEASSQLLTETTRDLSGNKPMGFLMLS